MDRVTNSAQEIPPAERLAGYCLVFLLYQVHPLSCQISASRRHVSSGWRSVEDMRCAMVLNVLSSVAVAAVPARCVRKPNSPAHQLPRLSRVWVHAIWVDYI
jgi:hypothetical protein